MLDVECYDTNENWNSCEHEDRLIAIFAESPRTISPGKRYFLPGEPSKREGLQAFSTNLTIVKTVSGAVVMTVVCVIVILLFTSKYNMADSAPPTLPGKPGLTT